MPEEAWPTLGLDDEPEDAPGGPAGVEPVAADIPALEGAASAAATTSAVPKLPEANEFSPGQVDLSDVLEIVRVHEGDRAGQIEALRARYFAASAASREDAASRLKQQQTRAYNVRIGMKGYGLLSFETDALTQLGRELASMNDAPARSDRFAAHILRNLHGLEVLRAITALQAREELVSKTSLAEELRRRGFTTLPAATTHHTKLLQWLREAGVVGARYEIDESRVQQLAGVSLADIGEWQSLSRPQRAFVRALRRIAEGGSADQPIAVKDVVQAAVFEHGPVFRDDQLRADVLRPLESGGWIATSGTGSGRGGKSGTVQPGERLLQTDFVALTGYARGDLPSEVEARLTTPLHQIAIDLRASDTHVKGLALEILAVRLAVDLTLVPLRFRLRSAKTGGAEVDLLAEGAHLHFSRWLFQCKNQASPVPLSDLAKEVGMATLMHGHVVVLATTGRFSTSVSRYAEELSRTSALQVVLLDGPVIRRYLADGPSAVRDHFHERALGAMRTKRSQIVESADEGDTS